MRRLWGLPLLILVGIAAACGGRDEADRSGGARVPKRADLAIMVLPKPEVGWAARDLRLDDASGPADNARAAKDTLDPSDTADDLARAGRVAGYAHRYARPAAFEQLRGVFTVATTVELFESDEAASGYLVERARELRRFRGKEIEDGVWLAEAGSFDVSGIGDEAHGLRATLRSRGVELRGWIVVFRQGRIVATADIGRFDAVDATPDVWRIAEALEERIDGILTGEIRVDAEAAGSGAKSKPPDPKLLTLTAKAFPLRTRLAHEGYVPAPGLRVYLREYDVRGGRLGDSKVIYLRTTTEVFETASAAARDQRDTATRTGSLSVARRFLRAYFRGTSRNVEARVLPAPARDAAAIHFSFDAPNGRVEVVMLSVVRGRVRGGVTVMGFDRDVDPADVLPFHEKIRARLSS